MDDTQNPQDDTQAVQDDTAVSGTGLTNAADDRYYSDDVQAAALADNNLDPDQLDDKQETPVTTGNMSLGDLDVNPTSNHPGTSTDEEDDAGGDNVADEDSILEEEAGV